MIGEKEWLRARRPPLQPAKSTSQPAQKASGPDALHRLGALTVRDLTAMRRYVGNQTLRRLAEQQAFEAPEHVERTIETERGKGRPLDHSSRLRMEGALGADLSDVRVHDDARSASMNQEISARAFTHGSDVFFGEGQYAPHTTDGQRLMAHELAHVIQQQSAPKLEVGAADDPAELAADQTADLVMERLEQVSRQEMPEEEELQMVRRQSEEEEDELQMLRRQPEEEEEELQMARRAHT